VPSCARPRLCSAHPGLGLGPLSRPRPRPWPVSPSLPFSPLWAALAARVVRRELRANGMSARVPRPPRLGRWAGRGVTGALSRLSPTCLERGLVLQAWLASQGTMRDVVIGLPPDGLKSQPAHAWVGATESWSAAAYLELHRLPSSVRAGRSGRDAAGGAGAAMSATETAAPGAQKRKPEA
jgi:hypothetical protein